MQAASSVSSEFAYVLNQLEAARCIEGVFTSEPSTFKTVYRHLLTIVHPDRGGTDAAVTKLNTLRSLADKALQNGNWGRRELLPDLVPIKVGAYEVEKKPWTGDVADVYFNDQYVIKVARSSDDNDLLRAERSALQLLEKKVEPPVSSGFPICQPSFKVGRREANVLQRMNGFFTAQEVRRRLPSIRPESLVWIFKRLLVLLEWSHHYGIVHGAILPPHVLLYPDNDEPTSEGGYVVPSRKENDPRKHTIRLIDWCYSVEYKKRTRLSAWIPAWKSMYAPELLAQRQGAAGVRSIHGCGAYPVPSWRRSIANTVTAGIDQVYSGRCVEALPKSW